MQPAEQPLESSKCQPLGPLWELVWTSPGSLSTSQPLHRPESKTGPRPFGRGGVQGQVVEGQNLVPGLEGASPGRLPTPSVWAPLGATPHRLQSLPPSLSSRRQEVSSSQSPGKGTEATPGGTHEHPLQYNLARRAAGSSGRKPVQLGQQLQADVLAPGLLATNRSVLFVAGIGFHDGASCSARSGKISQLLLECISHRRH